MGRMDKQAELPGNTFLVWPSGGNGYFKDLYSPQNHNFNWNKKS